MFNFRQAIRPLIPIATVLLLCFTAAPEAEANNGASAASSQKSATTSSIQQENKQDKPAPQKPKQKSVLDADVLENPLSYFRNSFSPEEDEDDLASHSNTLIITVKALIASVLSTII